MHFLHEVKASDELIRRDVGAGCRSQAHPCRLRVPLSRASPEPVATAEVMLLHVHQGEKPATAAFPPERRAALAGLKLTPAARAGVRTRVAQDRDRSAAECRCPPFDIQRLIAPRSIALIGAGAWTDAVAAGNAAVGYPGTIWRVHPTPPIDRRRPRTIARSRSCRARRMRPSSPCRITRRPASPASSPRAAPAASCVSAPASPKPAPTTAGA